MSRVPYSSAIKSLKFAMVSTKLDIAQVVGAVSEYITNLGRAHWTAVNWILHYLKSTSEAALCCNGEKLNLVGYVDADFVGDLDRRRSTTNYVFSLANGAFVWMLRLQSVVALSTTEAEINDSYTCM